MNYDAAALPESLRALADLIGLPAVIALAEHWGGIRLYIPQDIEADHIIARRIGLTAARKLSDVYRMETLVVPRACAALRAYRDHQIRARYAAGDSAARLAREFALTERQIFSIVAALEAPRMQANLF